jgi:hypothetical protein
MRQGSLVAHSGAAVATTAISAAAARKYTWSGKWNVDSRKTSGGATNFMTHVQNHIFLHHHTNTKYGRSE